ncbi:MAG: hypothetical protein J5643_05590 [Lachnospiraceae bacterium]|nr:hypothetical protein [Lachnospiraceae bacterium]
MIYKWDKYMPAAGIYLSGYSDSWMEDFAETPDAKRILDIRSEEWRMMVESFNENVKQNR